jgi:hypothetical protein
MRIGIAVGHRVLHHQGTEVVLQGIDGACAYAAARGEPCDDDGIDAGLVQPVSQPGAVETGGVGTP